MLRDLRPDIWVSSHARLLDRYRTFVASGESEDPVAPFIDPEGSRAYVDSAEAEFLRGVVH